MQEVNPDFSRLSKAITCDQILAWFRLFFRKLKALTKMDNETKEMMRESLRGLNPRLLKEVKKYLQEKIDEEKRVVERMEDEESKFRVELREKNDVANDQHDNEVTKNDKALKDCKNILMETDNRSLIDRNDVSRERAKYGMILRQKDKMSEESSKRKGIPRRRSNLGRLEVEIICWGNFMNNTEAVRESGGLPNQGVDRLWRGSKEISNRDSELSRTAGENKRQESGEKRSSRRAKDPRRSDVIEERNDGKGAILG